MFLKIRERECDTIAIEKVKEYECGINICVCTITANV